VSEPRAPYNVDIQLTRSLQKVATFEAQKPAIHAAGVEALKRLMSVARGDTGQSATIARFLLSCYNGTNFPLNVSDLRALDFDLHEDCMAVLKMDYSPEREIHRLVENGASIFEAMAVRWAPAFSKRLSASADVLSRIDPV
jgi:hypothetical protein